MMQYVNGLQALALRGQLQAMRVSQTDLTLRVASVGHMPVHIAQAVMRPFEAGGSMPEVVARAIKSLIEERDAARHERELLQKWRAESVAADQKERTRKHAPTQEQAIS